MTPQRTNDIFCGRVSIRWCSALLQKLNDLAREARAEFRRLNYSVDSHKSALLHSRRQRARAFKTVLAQRYRGHNHCC